MEATARILLIDDEPNTLKVLSAILKKNRYDVTTAKTAEEGLSRLSKTDAELVITDYRLPGMNGAEFVDAMRASGRNMPVIVLTAYGSIEKAVDAMKRGAFSYLAKPVNPDALLTSVREALEKRRLILENISLKSQLKERNSFNNIIGKSKLMQDFFTMIETVGRSNSSVLVSGESGTGKELVARAIHYVSQRADGPFITIDCASLPEALLESELFGHEKGAFTTAYDRKTGQIELGQGGTVLLDEVGELSLALQKKFLRFLQEREILRVGGKTRIKVDVRIIAATNRDLESLVKEGAFREDLFYRLNVVSLLVPPLRERKDDIPLLAKHFLGRFNEENRKAINSIDVEVMQLFMDHEWPGNVRELENTIERAVVLCPSDTITAPHLPASLRAKGQAGKEPAGEMNFSVVEKRLLLSALERTSWNQTRAAELLGISRKQLRTKMKNHDLLTED